MNANMQNKTKQNKDKNKTTIHYLHRHALASKCHPKKSNQRSNRLQRVELCLIITTSIKRHT